jgi:hypothetical protein
MLENKQNSQGHAINRVYGTIKQFCHRLKLNRPLPCHNA